MTQREIRFTPELLNNNSASEKEVVSLNIDNLERRQELLEAETVRKDQNETFIALGSVYRNGRTGQIIRAKGYKIHPDYLSTGLSDIGLIKLVRPVRLGNKVKVVKLHVDNKESLIGKTVFLTGFGIIDDFYNTPDRLRRATMHISSYQKCFSDQESSKTELCATSTVQEGKACKVCI
ncbi:trypsin [Holotrichia oblita]|uniref:Trypsin n=1 Tax=Holotrichia oblita TaxID=644536 RepID=A0ACB9SS68_HOLOL|nr:trypsin [Holotrichia oblita]